MEKRNGSCPNTTKIKRGCTTTRTTGARMMASGEIFELKPCPFCRCRYVYLEQVKRQCFVECSKCGATGPAYSRNEKKYAISAWNRSWPSWVSTKTTLPEDGRNVLIIHDKVVEIGYQYGGQWYTNTSGPVHSVVELWCDLPVLPKMSDGNQRA